MLTKEQIKERKRYIGGSDIGAIMGVSQYKTAKQLWLEKTGQVEPEDISHLPHVMTGNNLEPIIREWAEEKYGTKFPPCFVKSNKYDFMAANLDGLSELGCVLEIKTVGKDKNIMASLMEIPESYEMQLRWNMMCANVQHGLYVSYWPEGDETHYIEIERDLDIENQMIAAAIKFWGHVESMTEPDSEHVTTRLNELAYEYKRVKAELDEVNAKFEMIDNEIKEEFKKTGLNALDTCGLKFSRVERKGNINYKAIPQLKGLDLEQYRAKSTEYIKVQ
jgi:putative phage-type endonuclease